MKNLLLSFFLTLFTVSLFGQIMLPMADRKVSLNGNWKFKYINSLKADKDSTFYEPSFSVASWGELKVPSCWDRMGIVEPEYGTAVKEALGLYRTIFKVPEKWNGENIYIAFDGVGFGYRFWVNGNYAGSFFSEFNRGTFDISQFVARGKENTLAVEVSTRSRGWKFDTCDDWSFNGIIRDVTLFSLPQSCLADITVETKVENPNLAQLKVNTIAVVKEQGMRIDASLSDLNGKVVKTFPVVLTPEGTYQGVIDIANPRLWSAETPNLYNLTVSLTQKGKLIQKQQLRIGLREVTIDGTTLKINGTPIKLRGVTLHEESPVNGRTMTDAERLRDLTLVKKANINFIRTSHYQPSHRLIEMCDSMGFYVMDEVCFAGGRDLLANPEYLQDILMRTRLTVDRDKNYPSVIAWSVGNENQLTDNGIAAGKLIKQLDPTRPYCFPMMGSYFAKVKYQFPELVDIYAPHYPNLSNLEEFETSDKFDRPFIITEYAHAFGNGFDRLEKLWDYIYSSKRIAGGAVWHFFDQGLLRKSDTPITKTQFTQSVWIDSTTYYDSNKDKGPDGIVYADRTPQSDYWVVRKVYSPVQVIGDTIKVGTGKQQVKIVSENRYDFTNLSTLKMEWVLRGNRTVIQSGQSALNCPPKGRTSNTIDINIPAENKAAIFTLEVKYIDPSEYQLYEKSFVLSNTNVTKVTKESVAQPGLEFKLDDSKHTATLATSRGSEIIKRMPLLRVGRKLALWNLYDVDNTSPDSINITTGDAWFPAVIENPQILNYATDNGATTVAYRYTRKDDKLQIIDLIVTYTPNEKGWLDVKYTFTPRNAKGGFLEGGISMVIPASLTEFRFIGKGPYPSYPGKSRHVEPGVFHINSEDLNYAGSYPNVDVALLTNGDGTGFVILPNGSGISLERCDEGILLSHIPLISGTYAKKSMPDYVVKADAVGSVQGNFTIIPLDGEWPESLTTIFGSQKQTAKAFNPFYNYYDK